MISSAFLASIYLSLSLSLSLLFSYLTHSHNAIRIAHDEAIFQSKHNVKIRLHD